MSFGPAQGLGFSLGGGTLSGPILAPNGTAAAPSYSFSGGPTEGLYRVAAGTLNIAIAGARTHDFTATYYYLASDSAEIYLGASADVRIARDAAAVLALKNGTTAQEFRVYGSTTGPKYLALSHDGTDAVINGVGSGGGISFRTAGSSRWIINSHDVAGADRLVAGANYGFSNGTSALATGATEGFFHLQSCAGTPNGTPATIPTGQKPMVWDSTNKKLYVYDGSWLRGQVAAVDVVYA